MDAFDSHFHLDRLAYHLNETWDQTLKAINEPTEVPIGQPVKLVGGVMVFCDPQNYKRLPIRNTPFAVAVGVHPKHASRFTKDQEGQLEKLLKTRGVRALGEVGLDFSCHPDTWPRQEEVLNSVLGLCTPNFTLVLHLRGTKTDRHLAQVSTRCLEIVKRHCSKDQRIHLHCFTGGIQQLQEWRTAFTNCYFGFTGKVASFGTGQKEALRRVPADRLLLETDAPYMPMLPGLRTCSPAYIGEVARCVSQVRVEMIALILRSTCENGRRLYRMYQR